MSPFWIEVLTRDQIERLADLCQSLGEVGFSVTLVKTPEESFMPRRGERAATRTALIDTARLLIAGDVKLATDTARMALILLDEDVQRREGNSSEFDGAQYNPALDDNRLHSQLGRVFSAMSTGQWITLGELAELTGDPQPSISAQLRHLRKAKHGSWIVDSQRVERGGLFQYRLRNPDGSTMEQENYSGGF